MTTSLLSSDTALPNTKAYGPSDGLFDGLKHNTLDLERHVGNHLLAKPAVFRTNFPDGMELWVLFSQ